MKCIDRKHLLKEAQRTLDESDSTAAFCLCQRWILKDVIALLQEQEPVRPKVLRTPIGKDYYCCGICNAKIVLDDGFCWKCGRAVKWYD